MGLMTKPALDALVASGCHACGSKKLSFQTYVDGLVALMAGEPIQSVVWVYDGEKFLDGVYRVTCLACAKAVFEATACPRCHAEGGLARALTTENAYPVPLECRSCGGEETRYIAMMPAKVLYEGKRGEKAKTSHELHDAGFHGYRVDCKTCGTVAELEDECPLCGAAGPIRPRPA